MYMLVKRQRMNLMKLWMEIRTSKFRVSFIC